MYASADAYYVPPKFSPPIACDAASRRQLWHITLHYLSPTDGDYLLFGAVDAPLLIREKHDISLKKYTGVYMQELNSRLQTFSVES